MTTTEAQTNGPASSLDELAERIDTIARDVNRTPVLSVIRGLLNETGIKRARAVLMDAPDILANAQESLRVAQKAERSARESYDAAVLEGSWLIDAQFVVEKNRTWLVTPCSEGPHRSDDESLGTCTECSGTGEFRRQLGADEKRAYIAAAVAKMPEVAAASKTLHDASESTATARDDVEIARSRLSAAKYDVQAAIAELQILALAIPTQKGNA